MVWMFLVVLALITLTALSSLWWATQPLRAGAVLVAVTVLCTFGVTRQAAWGVSEVRREAGQWCLTYDHPNGTRFTECRPTESEAWAWAADLDRDLESEFGPLEKTTTAGDAFTVLFYVSLVGAIASVVWAAIQRRRSHWVPETEPAGTDLDVRGQPRGERRSVS